MLSSCASTKKPVQTLEKKKMYRNNSIQVPGRDENEEFIL